MKNPSFDSAEKDVSDVQHYEKAPPSSSVRSEPTSAMGQGGRTYRKAPFAWIQFREDYRQYFAEYFGTMILILFGNGVNCQTVLTKAGAAGNWNTINTGWGVGTAMGVWVSAGISGGHINPAVTLALATYRGFPWRKVPGYILAQVLGAFTAAALVYANYFHALDVFEGGSMVRTELTRGLFSTYAQPYMSNVSCFFDEFLGTFILVMVVLAIGDKKNCPPPAGLAPLVLYFLILGIGNSWGIETAYAINPARDFGPRLLTAAAGYGRGVWTYRHHYWIWCPILAPILGAQAAAWTYDTFLYSGTDSVITKRLVYDDEPTHDQMSREEKV